MKQEGIQKELINMMGKKYVYAKSLHTCKSYQISAEDETFTLITDLNTFKRKFESAADFFKYWEIDLTDDLKKDTLTNELAKRETASQLVVPTEVIPTDFVGNDLIEILKDNIKKISKDAKFLNQAKAIEKNVDTIVKVRKMQLDTIRETRKMK